MNPSGELPIGNFGVLAAPAPATANEGEMSDGSNDTNTPPSLSSVDFTALPYSDYDIPEPTNTFEDEEIRHVQPGWPAEGRDNAAITIFHS